MKHYSILVQYFTRVLLLFLLPLMLSSCAVVGGIFKTGFWIGAILVLVIVGFVVYIITKSKSNPNP